MRNRARALLFTLLLWPALAAAEDPLAEHRAKFEVGMSHFKSGDFAQAISYWQPIVKGIGDAKAYRLLYNLGVAYDQVGDATNAADRLRRFVHEAESRKREEIPAEVLEFEADARIRLARLDAQHGRIRLRFSEGLVLVFQIDGARRTDELAEPLFYVLPGAHTVIFKPGTPDEDKRELTVPAGEETVVTSKPPPPVPTVSAPPVVSYVVLPPPPAPPRGPPFSPIWIGVAGGLALASIALPLYVRGDAVDLKSEYDDPRTTIPRRQQIATDYSSDKTRYTLAWLLPAGLGVGTAALAGFYFFSPRGPEKTDSTTVGIAPIPGGAGLSVQGVIR